MLIRMLTFGILCGATAALVTLYSGAGGLAACAAYIVGGNLGLLAMALSGQTGR